MCVYIYIYINSILGVPQADPRRPLQDQRGHREGHRRGLRNDIYIYIYREREREMHVYIYIYIHTNLYMYIHVVYTHEMARQHKETTENISHN